MVERFFGTLKYEHVYRAIITDGDALAVEVAVFRQTYNTVRPHQASCDRTSRDTYLAHPTDRRSEPHALHRDVSSWLPSVSRRSGERSSRLLFDGSGKWLVRRAGTGL